MNKIFKGLLAAASGSLVIFTSKIDDSYTTNTLFLEEEDLPPLDASAISPINEAAYSLRGSQGFTSIKETPALLNQAASFAGIGNDLEHVLCDATRDMYYTKPQAVEQFQKYYEQGNTIEILCDLIYTNQFEMLNQTQKIKAVELFAKNVDYSNPLHLVLACKIVAEFQPSLPKHHFYEFNQVLTEMQLAIQAKPQASHKHQIRSKVV